MSGHNLSHSHKFDGRFGQLIPSLLLECMPAEKYELAAAHLIRLPPLLSPVYGDIKVTTEFFFVPNRLVWPNWQEFWESESALAVPTIQGMDTFVANDLADYMGLPTDTTDSAEDVCAMKIAAYCLIWDEYYRSRRLHTTRFQELLNGDNSAYYAGIAGGSPYNVCHKHEYFTAALDEAQAGSAVTIPVLTDGTANVRQVSGNTNPAIVRRADNQNPLGGSPTALTSKSGTGFLANTSGTDAYLDPNGSLEAVIAGEEAMITDLRRAFRLQEFLEDIMRVGQRYTEQILGIYGVKSPDQRLQRPEYIGGHTGTVTISEVLSTAQTYDATEPDVDVGDLSGHGISVSSGKRYRYRVTEHGHILGLTYVRPEVDYVTQGIHRMWSRTNKLDYPIPHFANIGEQAILVKELWLGAGTNKDNTWGS